MQETRLDPWVGKIPWRREWQPTPVFSPGESHGQRSLAGYSPRGSQRVDMTERAAGRESTEKCKLANICHSRKANEARGGGAGCLK